MQTPSDRRCALLRAMLSLAVLGLLTTGVPAGVAAAPGDEAQALYEAAKADLKEGRHVFALKKFKQALALAKDDPESAWPMMMGTALTYEQMGQIEFTLEYYRLFLDSVERNRAAVTEKWTRRIAVVEDQVTALENRLLEERGLVEVNSTPPGARITVDGNVPGADGDATTPFPVYMTPGTHVVRIEKEGYQPTDLNLQVKTGEREARNVQLAVKKAEGRLIIATGAPDANVSVDELPVGTGRDVSLKVGAGPHLVRVERVGYLPFEKRVDVGDGAIVRVEALLAAAPAEATPEAGVQTEHSTAPRLAPLWGYLGGGAGVALVGVGAVFSVLRNSDVDSIAGIDATNPGGLTASERRDLLDRRSDLAGSVKTKEVLAGVFYGLGGAAVAGSAVYLAFFADWGKGAPEAAPPVSIQPLPGGVALTTTLSW